MRVIAIERDEDGGLSGVHFIGERFHVYPLEGVAPIVNADGKPVALVEYRWRKYHLYGNDLEDVVVAPRGEETIEDLVSSYWRGAQAQSYLWTALEAGKEVEFEVAVVARVKFRRRFTSKKRAEAWAKTMAEHVTGEWTEGGKAEWGVESAYSLRPLPPQERENG